MPRWVSGLAAFVLVLGVSWSVVDHVRDSDSARVEVVEP